VAVDLAISSLGEDPPQEDNDKPYPMEDDPPLMKEEEL
jgi:hypothetical protein